MFYCYFDMRLLQLYLYFISGIGISLQSTVSPSYISTLNTLTCNVQAFATDLFPKRSPSESDILNITAFLPPINMPLINFTPENMPPISFKPSQFTPRGSMSSVSITNKGPITALSSFKNSGPSFITKQIQHRRTHFNLLIFEV